MPAKPQADALDAYLQTRSTASLQTVAARHPCDQPGAMGAWSLELYSASRFEAMATGANPHGLITLPAAGWLAIDLHDFQGWHPFLAVAGMDAGRQFQANVRYGHDGTSVLMTSQMANFDPTLGRYIVYGPMSNGTLGANGFRSRIEFTTIDGQPMTVSDCWVGWDQSAI